LPRRQSRLVIEDAAVAIVGGIPCDIAGALSREITDLSAEAANRTGELGALAEPPRHKLPDFEAGKRDADDARCVPQDQIETLRVIDDAVPDRVIEGISHMVLLKFRRTKKAGLKGQESR
jgi:hypothetical protein